MRWVLTAIAAALLGAAATPLERPALDVAQEQTVLTGTHLREDSHAAASNAGFTLTSVPDTNDVLCE